MLRPKKIDDIVGQGRAKLCIKTLVESAKRRKSAIPMMLVTGPAGTGKTTLAQAAANELGTNIQFANGGNTAAIKDIMPMLLQITTGSIIFIDEVHRLPAKVQEFLFTAMEDFCIDMKGVRIPLAEFTLVGATTDAGKLLKPFHDRFTIRIHLDDYTETEIETILALNSKILNIGSIHPSIIKNLARRSRRIPRIANSHLVWIRDYIVANRVDLAGFTETHLNTAMTLIGVDKLGLTHDDRVYIRYLKSRNKKPVGLKTVSSATSLSQETIENTIEPWLLKLNMIEKTQKGRILL